MSSIHTEITIKIPYRRRGIVKKKDEVMTKAIFLRKYSKIARKESDEDMQAFFDAFKI